MTAPPLEPTPPLGSTEPPTLVRYRVMAFLLVLSALTYFDRVCIVRVQREIQRDLNLTDDQLGWVFGAFWLAYALFEIPTGWLGDRFGSRRTLTRVVLVWSLFTFLTGSATGFITLIAFRFLFGAGEAGAYPNMARVQGAWLPLSVRGRASGALWFAARWGGAFSPFLFAAFVRFAESPAFRAATAGLPVIDGAAGWRVGFWMAGFLGVAWCLLFYPWFRDDPAQHKSVNAAELNLIRAGGATEPASHGVRPGVWRALLGSRNLWAIGLMYLFLDFGWSFFVSWMPRFLQDQHGLQFDGSESVWRQPLLYGGVACLVGGVVSDRLVRWTGRPRLGRAICPLLGLCTAGSAMAAIPFVRTADQAVALLCLAGAAIDFGQASNWATIVDVGGRNAGIAAGFVNMVGNLANAIQPRVGVWIFTAYGWDALFIVYAVMFFLSASMWLIINPTRRFHD